jgi:hypothetical protein
MKKLLLFVGLSIIIISCGRNWTCSCSGDRYPSIDTNFIETVKSDDAEEICNKIQGIGANSDPSYTCGLEKY